MTPMLYPWQNDAWLQLQTLGERLPHALLFHGQAGTGKSDFAEAFAQALLCESRQPNGYACGTCLSCGWFVQYSHPDYRQVRPDSFDDDEGGEDDESDAGKAAKSSKVTKAPSKDIRIEQIRALATFIHLSTHRQGKRVVLLYPAEALNSASANAILKTLEEPPPETVFLLVSNHIERLLPTILSRCRQFAMPMPSTAQALTWLKTQQIDAPEVWLSEQGGAPLAALAMAQSGSRETQDELLAVLMRPSVEAALKAAERLQKAVVADLVVGLQRWLHDLCLWKLTGKIRYHLSKSKEVSQLAQKLTIAQLMAAVKSAQERHAIAEHPLSARLFIEDMLLDYSALFS